MSAEIATAMSAAESIRISAAVMAVASLSQRPSW